MSYKEESACETLKQQQERYMRQSQAGTLGGSIGGIGNALLGAVPVSKTPAEQVSNHLGDTVERIEHFSGRLHQIFEQYVFSDLREKNITEEKPPIKILPPYFSFMEERLDTIDDVIGAMNRLLDRAGL